MTTDKESKWRERVQAWRSSGESASAFAASEGFAASTLRYWASRLKAQERGRAVSSPVKASVPMAQLVRRRGISVLPAAFHADPPARGEIAVVVGTARVTVGRGFDAQLLREVVLALGGAQ